jgi:hypothetical protein
MERRRHEVDDREQVGQAARHATRPRVTGPGERAGMRTQRDSSRDQAGRPPPASPGHRQYWAGENRSSSPGFSVSQRVSYGILALDARLWAGWRVTITTRRMALHGEVRRSPGQRSCPQRLRLTVPAARVTTDGRVGRVRDLDEPLRTGGSKAAGHQHDREQARRRPCHGRSTGRQEEE